MPSAGLPETAVPIHPASTLVLFRYADYDTPFWDRINTRPGRWHRIGDPATQYWSLTPEAAWAELIRWEELLSERDLELVRKPMWACRVKPGMLVDLRDEDEQTRYGISADELVDDDHSVCQDLGPRLRQQGSQLVLAPSAALQGHTNLTMFGKRRMSDWRLPPPLVRTLPATVVAVGRPPEGLLQKVRRRSRIPGQLF